MKVYVILNNFDEVHDVYKKKEKCEKVCKKLNNSTNMFNYGILDYKTYFKVKEYKVK